MPMCLAYLSSRELVHCNPLAPVAFCCSPLRCAYADTFGVALDCRIRLTVISVCGRSLSHKLGGKSSATPASTLRKWALKFRIATSAALRRWHPGGTSSMLSLHLSRMWFFMFSDTSLSRTCFLGSMPARLRRRMRALYALIISASLRLFIGSTRMALLSISTITMMYLFPRCDRVGY